MVTFPWQQASGRTRIVLVDLARHVSRAYEQSGTHDSSEALSRIRAGFEAEWNTATSEATGELLDDAS